MERLKCAWCGETATHEAVEVAPAVYRKGKAIRDKQGKSLGRPEELVQQATIVPLCDAHKQVRDRDYADRERQIEQRRLIAAKKAWETRKAKKQQLTIEPDPERPQFVDDCPICRGFGTPTNTYKHGYDCARCRPARDALAEIKSASLPSPTGPAPNRDAAA